MPEAVAQPEASAVPLSQVQRVVDTFVAPSKTFTDILRSASWWMPWLIGVIVTLGLGFAVQQKIGWDKTYDNILRQQSATQQQRMEQMPADQQARVKAMGTNFVKMAFWATPVLALLFAAIAAGVLLASINFGVGGHASYPKMFALWMYGTLPWAIQGLLGIITIYAGVDPDSFNLNNFVGTNIGYYLPPDSAKWLLALGQSIDIFTIWALILLTIGCAIIGKVKRGQAGVVVWGWWIVITLVRVGLAAIRS